MSGDVCHEFVDTGRCGHSDAEHDALADSTPTEREIRVQRAVNTTLENLAVVTGAPTEREAGDVGEVAAVLDWRFFKAHAPIGAYLPTGQMGGDCRECRTAWPCAPYLAALAPLIAERERAAGARALREAADEAEALRSFAHGKNPTSEAHLIGYGTARRVIVRQLRERADQIGGE